MLLSILLIMATTAGGLAVTYVMRERDEPLMWRLAAGSVIGSVICGTAAFALSLAAGLGIATAAVSIAVAMAPLLLFTDYGRRHELRRDLQRARGKLDGATPAKFRAFLYYAFFFVLFCVYFSYAMYETPEGIFTGGSQNLGDLPFHLGAIYSFTDGNNFPPQNPSFAGARFSYPFIADLLTAVYAKLGADIRPAMIVQDVAWAFALLIVLQRFVARMTGGDRLAEKLGAAMLFFSGGLGFVWFLSDYWQQAKSFTDFVWSIPGDYTITNEFRWGNSLVTLFITQRSLLLGMPLTIVVLGWLWDAFREKLSSDSSEAAAAERTFAAPFVLGLLAGTLPLVHLHSLVVLFVVGVFLFIFRPEKWRVWTTFAAGVAVVAVPELLWAMQGTASRPSEFIAPHFGWDKGETNFVWFWIKNVGLFIPLIATGIYLLATRRGEANKDLPDMRSLVFFYVPFAFCFVIANSFKLAPWEWDNIKVLIYWFVGSIPLVAYALAWAWRRSGAMRVVAAAAFVSLIFSGAIDVWRTASGQIKTKVFTRDDVEIARQVRQRTEADAILLNAPTYNSAAVLTGRLSFIRYPGHLSSHGIDHREREEQVKQMYAGGPAAEKAFDIFGIKYVLVTPAETGSLSVNQAYFSKFPVAAEAGQNRLYKVR
ncbi:MAG: hypothetical protein ACK4S4_02595 [Pyrinomonadaceae bacterium]